MSCTRQATQWHSMPCRSVMHKATYSVAQYILSECHAQCRQINGTVVSCILRGTCLLGTRSGALGTQVLALDSSPACYLLGQGVLLEDPIRAHAQDDRSSICGHRWCHHVQQWLVKS